MTSTRHNHSSMSRQRTDGGASIPSRTRHSSEFADPPKECPTTRGKTNGLGCRWLRMCFERNMTGLQHVVAVAVPLPFPSLPSFRFVSFPFHTHSFARRAHTFTSSVTHRCEVAKSTHDEGNPAVGDALLPPTHSRPRPLVQRRCVPSRYIPYKTRLQQL